MKEQELMQKCFALAKRGKNFVSPNPLVGAILVKNNKIISAGFHASFGKTHAEAIAIKKAGKKARGSTLFVNLEPCCHFGKQPPCTDAIKAAKIKKVVIGVRDPNPIVSGKGIKELKKSKITVVVGVLKKEAILLNEKFFKFKKTKLPFILIKNAVSLNGKINYSNNKRKKISGKESLKKVRELRGEFDAILVGVNTVIKDNPRLTTRIKGIKDPLRIIVDGSAKIPLNSKVLNDNMPTIVVCTKKAKKLKIKKVIKKGGAVIIAKEKNGLVDLSNLLKQLGQMGLSSVLVEGGAKITSSFLQQNLFDKMILIISPNIISKGLDFLTKKELLKKLVTKKIEYFGKDTWVTFYPKKGMVFA